MAVDVDPFIGTAGHGHTYPGATVPFGMVQLGPDTRRDTWDGCSGYYWADNSILGFSHTHLSGTGCGDLGDISFIPTSNKIDLNATFDYNKYRIPFSHKDEKAYPGYYSVNTAGIKAELTASKHAGVHRYTFEKGKDASVIIDLTHGIQDEVLELIVNIRDDHTVTGLRRSKGWAKNQFVYFAATFSQPFSSFGTINGNEKPSLSSREANGKQIGCWLNFDTNKNAVVVAKVGISGVSEDAALNNLKSEVADFDFDQTCKQAQESWNKELGKIQVNTADKQKAKTFYTSLYHSLLAPTIVSDVDGNYRGSDAAVHKAVGFENYSTFSLWDTFRAEHPLLTIIEPARVNDFIKSFMVQAEFEEQKTLPIWPLASNETRCMIGYHSFPVIAEAYSKGFRDWDSEGIFKLMVANTARNDWWAEKGYIPADKEEESVSKTLEFAYDDWCLAQFAKALGHSAEAEKFAKRGNNYKNVFDKETEFMRGRFANGSWRTPFDATLVAGGGPLRDFTEGNSWQYSFFVPHDVATMIDCYGGREKFIAKLDKMFAEPIKGHIDFNDVSGLIGQYAQGNEPSHHVAYLYSYAGAPAKTAERVKQICDSLYNSTPEGLCGNEDCGQMSAWYIFSALGFYPVNPVSGNYVIGTPAFDKSCIKLPNEK
ncbi:MAG: GH92 family glycosyl hydrolase, partial [Candidatus Obscuribacterales bacterium]|nr:GH92 family glycosyl hydrolase [Candidatus Obscuribacterales bacterium]